MLRRWKKLLLCACAANAGADGDVRVADEPDVSFVRAGGQLAARRLEWADVESLTCGFTSAVVGEGGFSTVYLGRLPAGWPPLAAVKVHRGSERMHRAFRRERDALRRLQHPHIVRLLAFCDGNGTDEGALVLEFAPNGNLHEKLHDGGAAMPWAVRAKVALQVAAALEYLHDKCELQIVHGDVKGSNVLLDAAMDAKLCDFGSARTGFSAAVRPRSAVVGSPGYVDPHCLISGMVTTKTDVYSFGVLLLELLTGMQAFHEGRLLTATLGPLLRQCDAGDVGGVVDPRLGHAFDAAEARAVAVTAARCVGGNPSLRPSMGEVARILAQALSGSISTVDCRSDGPKWR